MNNQQAHYWQGRVPTHCADCRTHIKAVFANLNVGQNQWNIYCSRCAARHVIAYGYNAGQRYMKQNDGRYAKVAG
jgi:hypothetical protein